VALGGSEKLKEERIGGEKGPGLDEREGCGAVNTGKKGGGGQGVAVRRGGGDGEATGSEGRNVVA